jgi:hypothetical protein
MRKRLLLTALLLCVGLLCLIVWQRQEIPNRISHGTFEQIEKGMTRDRVVELLGVSPGDYVTKDLHFVMPVNKDLVEDARLAGHDDEIEEVWAGNGGKVTVWFRGDGTVSRRTYMPAAFPPSLVDRIRAWAGF